ncbi:MAG TPA: class I SAM-dependent methyltransferase [Saprospiraceae bacterium]|nr:methyltransferase [Flavobacterium sp.]HRQ30388.1 class I SAM-dependent methyltransferase [Saprospiraceae bacterium]
MKAIISKFLIRRGFKKLQASIRSLGPNTLNPAETISFLYSKDSELIQPWQFKEELTGLATEISTRKPKTILEIGTANGGTLFMASRLAADDALIISIDLPGGKFGGGYPDWKEPIYKSFARANQKIELLRMDSHLESTEKRLKEVLNGRTIDYLFIDGDHTYEGAKHDYYLYSKYLSKGGLIGMHDIVIHPNSKCDVYKLWVELKNIHKHKEYVNNWDQGCYGVGVLFP